MTQTLLELATDEETPVELQAAALGMAATVSTDAEVLHTAVRRTKTPEGDWVVVAVVIQTEEVGFSWSPPDEGEPNEPASQNLA